MKKYLYLTVASICIGFMIAWILVYGNPIKNSNVEVLNNEEMSSYFKIAEEAKEIKQKNAKGRVLLYENQEKNEKTVFVSYNSEAEFIGMKRKGEILEVTIKDHLISRKPGGLFPQDEYIIHFKIDVGKKIKNVKLIEKN